MKNSVGVHIDFDKCNYCMECVNKCRSNALSEKDGEIIVNPEECRLDSYCLSVCDEEAIWVVLGNGTIERY